ncbi:hypothetical protein RDABS01_034780 [Bienertia sinuspersici]
MILQEVESRFLYPKSLEKWILKSIGHKWRDYKCLLKGKGYDDNTDINTLYDNCPDEDVDYDQWVSLVNFWRSEEGKRRRNCSKESFEKDKVKPVLTTGTKNHARVHEEMSSNKSPTQTQVYLKCHQHESEADITNQIKNVATEQGDQELGIDDNPVSQLQLYIFLPLGGVVQRLRTRVKRKGIPSTKVKRKLRDHDISLFDESESDANPFSSDSDSEVEAEHDDQNALTTMYSLQSL